jgi:5-methyltetrahydrofolate--homocysteine methyltransferase
MNMYNLEMIIQNVKSDKNYISLDKARQNNLKIDWKKSIIKKPNKLGVTVLKDFSLETLRKYIDWTPFFIPGN